jgi:hypothetical protein
MTHKSFKVIKKNKRLVIVNSHDEVVYTPPDHLRSYIQSRNEMVVVAEKLANNHHYIDIIREFEKIVWNRHLKKTAWICPIDEPNCISNCGNYGCGN